MKSKHKYAAKWDNGVQVFDENGQRVKVSFGATTDTQTCYAYLPGIGFIGGWQCMPKRAKMKFKMLVDYINAGVLYGDMNELPRGRARRRY